MYCHCFNACDHEQSWEQSLHTVYATYCAVHAMISHFDLLFVIMCFSHALIVLHLVLDRYTPYLMVSKTSIFITVGPLLGPILVIP